MAGGWKFLYRKQNELVLDYLVIDVAVDQTDEAIHLKRT